LSNGNQDLEYVFMNEVYCTLGSFLTYVVENIREKLEKSILEATKASSDFQIYL